TGLYFDVRQRRREWLLPGSTLHRHHAPCDLLRGWPFSPGHGCRGHVRHLRWDLLLVSQDDRTNDERDFGEDSLLVQLCGRLLHLYAVPLPGNGRECAPLFVVPG